MCIYILEIVGCTDMGANLWGAVGVEVGISWVFFIMVKCIRLVHWNCTSKYLDEKNGSQ